MDDPYFATDPRERRIVLSDGTVRHILDRHPEMAPYLPDMMRMVEEPDHVSADARPGRERYWSMERGPSRWLLVVVDFTSTPARIVTAYGRRGEPR